MVEFSAILGLGVCNNVQADGYPVFGGNWHPAMKLGDFSNILSERRFRFLGRPVSKRLQTAL
jgi:hypothetical protein